ncbi:MULTISPECIES: HAAS signaling domain-containing protein [Cytobacillus]|uniref:Uncharacterized protein n=1 Tax=Cytobacillus stercorigallinarum TaxID=2762240 RepID=A0ABR8QN47_9BACI|nr:hypothetical protein [Cytobacillus stercorigallinarum]MBD7936960.1 hypothetical protein [Cytobacillus stercorigallinarum]
MEWIEVYIHEVTKRLPEKQRNDIALELKSSILDALPENYTLDDEKAVLADLGDPAEIAKNYRDAPSYLIGPDYYDLFMTTVKMILQLAIGFAIAYIVFEGVVTYLDSNQDWTYIFTVFGKGIWTVLSTAIQVVFWVAFVFIIMERTGVAPYEIAGTGAKWTPDDLKNITVIPKKKGITKVDIFAAFLWTAIWGSIYFFALDIVGIYTQNNQETGLTLLTPIFNQEFLLSFWPLVLIVLLCELTLTVYKWVKRQWTKSLATINTVYQLLYTIVFLLIILQPNLFHSDLINELSQIFNTTAANISSILDTIIGVSIAVTIISAVYASYDGFKKSKIKNDTLL